MSEQPVYVVPKGESMMNHVSDVADTLLKGGIVEAGELVYLPRTEDLGYEIQTAHGQWLASVRTKSADASQVPQGGLVEIDAEARARAKTPYAQDSVMQGLLLLLQYMSHKAHMHQDPRFAVAAAQWNKSKSENRSSYRAI